MGRGGFPWAAQPARHRCHAERQGAVTLTRRAEPSEPRQIARGEPAARGSASPRLNSRGEDAYDVGFGPGMVHQFDELTPRDIRLCLDVYDLFGHSAHELVQPFGHFRNGRAGLVVQPGFVSPGSRWFTRSRLSPHDSGAVATSTMKPSAALRGMQAVQHRVRGITNIAAARTQSIDYLGSENVPTLQAAGPRHVA